MDSELQKLPDISSLGASRAPRGGGSAAQGRPGRSVDKPSTPGDEMKGALAARIRDTGPGYPHSLETG